MSAFVREVEDFVSELDAAVENHLEWTRRVLRCAVSRASPGDDVLAPDAHCRCRFGRWVASQSERFKQVDEAATLRILDHHERMHAAIRRLCSSIVAGGTGSTSDLDQFESTQSKLVDDLARFKTKLLEHGARRDFLTGLPLRYGLEAEYDRFRFSARRFGKKVALILIDIDHFKRINDTYGHGVGDLALKHAAEILKRQARRGEPIFRFGGEEFLQLAMVDTAIDAEGAATRLLQAFRDTPMQVSEKELLGVRVSAGLALAEHDEDMGEAVARADRALYSAKGAGRNCCRWAERPAHEPAERPCC